MRNQFFIILIIFGITVSMQSCMKDKLDAVEIEEEIQQANQYVEFDYSTIEKVTVSIKALTNTNTPIEGAFFQIYSSDPLTEYGTIKATAETNKLFQGSTLANGIFEFSVNLPTSCKEVFILSKYIGLESLQSAKVSSQYLYFTFGGATSSKTAMKLKSGAAVSEPSIVNGYYTLGSWNRYGVPDYLVIPDDQISSDLLADINASLPESQKLPDSHPQYLSSDNDANIVVTQECEIWVTFVHEGAGWHNSLGYYSYSSDSPPQSVSDIKNEAIIFPDVTVSSNVLHSGNKVKLQYIDPQTGVYSNTFPAGTTIGWFLIAQGWNSTGQTVSNGIYKHYSNTQFNIEADSDLQKHNVLLYDEARELLLLGFEDIRRDITSCDQDFNDAIFYATANPLEAIQTDIYQPIDNPTDTDNDGVSNVFDQYPDNPQLAYNNFYPAPSVFGSLAFEDLWPSRGDYDFNDLVIDYNFNQLTNAQNKVVEVQSAIVVRAIGASYHNAFGISFNTPPGNISQTSGTRINHSFLSINDNGTEKNQSKATIIYFDDAFNALPYPGEGVGVNTVIGTPYVWPDTMNVQIKLNTAESINTFGLPPYNPFIIIDRNRDYEVHLPNYEPTDLANTDLFGTKDDKSSSASGKYYISKDNLPWAINLPVSFDYPKEKAHIEKTHLLFDDWAKSIGFSYMDWYENKTGYRNSANIYK